MKSLVLLTLSCVTVSFATTVCAFATPTKEHVSRLSAVFGCYAHSPQTESPRVVLYTATTLATTVIPTNPTFKFIRHGLKMYVKTSAHKPEIWIGDLENTPECSDQNRGNILRPVPVSIKVKKAVTFEIAQISSCKQISANNFTRTRDMAFTVTSKNNSAARSWQETNAYTSLIECESP